MDTEHTNNATVESRAMPNTESTQSSIETTSTLDAKSNELPITEVPSIATITVSNAITVQSTTDTTSSAVILKSSTLIIALLIFKMAQ